MNFEIIDEDLNDILKVAVKEEIQFLAQALLARPDIRQVIWAFTTNQFDASFLKDSGLSDATIKLFLQALAKQDKPPSGAGGGASAYDPVDTPSGGGGRRSKKRAEPVDPLEPAKSVQPIKPAKAE